MPDHADRTGQGPTRRALLMAAPILLTPGAAWAALAPTPAATEGPFYPVGRFSDDDADLVRIEGAVRDAGGDILHLAGRVLDVNARPLAGARVEIWQCDVNGVYRHPGDRRIRQRDAAFQGFGHAVTGQDGRVAFRTIVPVPYPGRTPHIHVKVLSRGRAVLTSQLYRAGHPGNATDFLFNRLSADEQSRVSMTLRPRGDAPRAGFETAIDLVVGG